MGAAAAVAIVAIGFFLLMPPGSGRLPVEPLVPTPTSTYYVNVPVPGPTVTKTAKPEPRPTKTIYVEREAETSRNYERVPVNATMACIREHESGGSYTARNGIYRGAYQLSMTYSDTWAQRAGYSEWSSKPADQWPPAVQDAVALDLGKSSNWRAWSDWTSYSCPGFVS